MITFDPRIHRRPLAEFSQSGPPRFLTKGEWLQRINNHEAVQVVVTNTLFGHRPLEWWIPCSTPEVLDYYGSGYLDGFLLYKFNRYMMSDFLLDSGQNYIKGYIDGLGDYALTKGLRGILPGVKNG